MRYDLTNHEWAAIKPMLPNTSYGVSREQTTALTFSQKPNRSIAHSIDTLGSRFL